MFAPSRFWDELRRARSDRNRAGNDVKVLRPDAHELHVLLRTAADPVEDDATRGQVLQAPKYRSHPARIDQLPIGQIDGYRTPLRDRWSDRGPHQREAREIELSAQEDIRVLRR